MSEPATPLPRPQPVPGDNNILKHAALAFVLALLGYIFFYACDARLRTRHGAWLVEFQVTTNQEPLLIINEPKLGIRNVGILFKGESTTNAGYVKRFDKPTNMKVPYGRVRFHDLTYLPGTITMDLFGHEIEMLPRTLFINTKEVPWRNDSLHVLTATNKIPGLKDRDRKGRR
jgi:hypothetical protein